MNCVEENTFRSGINQFTDTDFLLFDYAKKLFSLRINCAFSAFNILFIGRHGPGASAKALLHKTGESMGRMHTAW